MLNARHMKEQSRGDLWKGGVDEQIHEVDGMIRLRGLMICTIHGYDVCGCVNI